MQSKASQPEPYALLFMLFAILLGFGCGSLQVWAETLDEPDPLLSALAVTCCTMLLGVIRPQRPWRWVLAVGIPVPLAVYSALLSMPTAHFTKATIAGSFLVSLPGCAGAIGGSIMRRKLHDIFYEDMTGEEAYAEELAAQRRAGHERDKQP
ncbi:MAG: hypothetical protein P4M01_02015 [Acidobacteriota bacterium]|nr:hypothetical protein [Acidobacteriota bacterium]